ncbi:MAG: GAF domain-containing protein, partial [Anaerolineae bacterium]
AAANLDDLYRRVVTEVKEQFHYYHAQLLRHDPLSDAVVLVAGYGPAGQKMLAAGHRMPLGQGLVGLAAASGESVLRSNVTNDPTWQFNPLLPDTKGELAVPIKLAEQVLGVLDVQSEAPDLLDANDQLLLEGLCGQIAIAIENTRLRQEMESRLQELSSLQQLTTREGWHEFLQSQRAEAIGYLSHQGAVRPLTAAEGQPDGDEVAPPGGSVINPMTVNNQVIGGLGVYDDPQNPLLPEEQELLDAISQQAAEALERARLLEQTQKQARQMQASLAETEALYGAGRAIGEAKTIEQIVRGAAQIAPVAGFDVCSLALITAFTPQGLPQRVDYYGVKVEDGNLVPLAAEATTGIWNLQLAQKLLREPENAAVYRDIEDPHTSAPPDVRRELRRFKLRGGVVRGLQGRTEPVGFLYYTSYQPLTGFTDAHLRQLHTVADQVVIALENRRLFEQTQATLAKSKAQARRLAQLNAMSRQLNLAQTEDEIFEIAVAQVGQIFQADRAGVALLNESGDSLTGFTVHEDGDEPPAQTAVPLEGTLHQQAIRNNRVVNRSQAQPGEPGDIQSYLVAPLKTGEQPVGTLSIESSAPNYFTPADEQLMWQVASLLSSAIENKRLFERTQIALAEAEATQRRYTLQAWETYRRRRGSLSYEEWRDGEAAAEGALPPEAVEAVAKKQTVVIGGRAGDNGRSGEIQQGAGLIVPLTLRDEVIGVLGLQETDRSRVWLPEEIAILEAVAGEFTQVAEELRLLDETQQRAALESRINEIGEHIQAAQSLEEALQIAVKDVGLSLKSPRATVQLAVNLEETS